MDNIYTPDTSEAPPPERAVVRGTESVEAWRDRFPDHPAADDSAFARVDHKRGRATERPLTVEEAASRLTKRRREAGDEDQLVVRKSEGGPQSLRQAADDLSFTRKLEYAQELVAAGVPEEKAWDTLTHENVPVPVGLVDEHGRVVEPLGDRRPSLDEALTVSEAAKGLSRWREAVEQQRQAELAQLAGQQEAEVAQAEQQLRAHEERQRQVQQQERVKAEHARLLQERAAIANAARMSAAERQAVQTGSQILQQAAKEFPELRTPADIERLRVTNPQRFARYKALENAGNQKVAEIEGLVAKRRLTEVHTAALQGKQLAAYREAEDAKFETWASQNLSGWSDKQTRSEIRDATWKILESDPQALAAVKSGKRVLNSLEQQALAKAAAFDVMRAKAQKIRQTPLPPVQRPGVSRPAGASNAETIAAIDKQLETAVGDRAIRLATNRLQAKRAARG